jgi:hypothetical protein
MKVKVLREAVSIEDKKKKEETRALGWLKKWKQTFESLGLTCEEGD